MTTANYQDRGGSSDEDATTELPRPLWEASGDTPGTYAIRLPDDLAQHMGGDLPVGSMTQAEHDALWPDLARTRARTRGDAGEGA